MYPLHKSDTGSFQELLHASEVEFGQLSILTVAPLCIRGDHYHTHKREWFCCTQGRCCILVTDVQTKKQYGVKLDSDHREFIAVNPLEAHVVSNPYKQECELLVVSSEEYDPDNPDTIPYANQK